MHLVNITILTTQPIYIYQASRTIPSKILPNASSFIFLMVVYVRFEVYGLIIIL